MLGEEKGLNKLGDFLKQGPCVFIALIINFLGLSLALSCKLEQVGVAWECFNCMLCIA